MLVVKNTRLINTGNIITSYAMLSPPTRASSSAKPRGYPALRVKHLFSTNIPSSLLAIQDHSTHTPTSAITSPKAPHQASSQRTKHSAFRNAHAGLLCNAAIQSRRGRRTDSTSACYAACGGCRGAVGSGLSAAFKHQGSTLITPLPCVHFAVLVPRSATTTRAIDRQRASCASRLFLLCTVLTGA
jgi:hypothetical protein